MTEVPQVLDMLEPRGVAEVALMAHAVQANVVTLKVAASRRMGVDSASHEIATPAPGAVTRFRDVLVDRECLAAYSDEELALRLRQVWGEFAALCWTLGCNDPHRPPAFAELPANHPMQCPMTVQHKQASVQKCLWRLRHEQRLRFDPEARNDPAFRQEYEVALSTPVMVYGQNVRVCSNEELVLCACEFAGMLAALRWVSDVRWQWEADGIMCLA
jgi:hypothetical protein